MKIVFDTNVVLDLLLDRQPFSNATLLLFTKVNLGDISGYLCATSITTVYYIGCKSIGARKTREHIRNLLSFFSVAEVNHSILESALNLNFRDYEDAVLQEAAMNVQAHGIVTRDKRDFKQSMLKIYSPNELLQILDARSS